MSLFLILTHIGALLVGGGCGFGLRILLTRQSVGDNGYAANQSGRGAQQIGNVAGGDIAARDVIKK